MNTTQEMKEEQKTAVEDYIKAYNNFDIEGMKGHLHQDIIFENITNGEVDLRTNGIAEFSVQAEKAKAYFTERKQTIEGWNFLGDKVVIEIDYEGILAIDLPNGAEKGDTLALKGQSEFKFDEGKIISIKDMS